MLLARWNVQKISVRISVDALKLCLYFIFIILLIELGMTGYKTFRALSLSVFSLIWMYHVLGETLKFSFLLCISSLLQKRCHQFGSYICIQIALLFNGKCRYKIFPLTQIFIIRNENENGHQIWLIAVTIYLYLHMQIPNVAYQV